MKTVKFLGRAWKSQQQHFLVAELARTVASPAAVTCSPDQDGARPCWTCIVGPHRGYGYSMWEAVARAAMAAELE